MTKLFAGIDIGSTNSKACIIDLAGNVVGYSQNATSSDRGESGEEAFENAIADASVSGGDILYVGAKGYGRRKFERADVVYPEVLCHAMGAEQLFPGTRTVIDVGGQDCKIIQQSEGLVLKFEMNDKCSRGICSTSPSRSCRIWPCNPQIPRASARCAPCSRNPNHSRRVLPGRRRSRGRERYRQGGRRQSRRGCARRCRGRARRWAGTRGRRSRCASLDFAPVGQRCWSHRLPA